MTDIDTTQLKDGRIVITMTPAQMEFARAYQYQERHGLSLTKAAIKRRIKTWHQQQDMIMQSGADGCEGVKID